MNKNLKMCVFRFISLYPNSFVSDYACDVHVSRA